MVLLEGLLLTKGMTEKTISKREIIILIVLLVGLAVTVWLVGQQTVFKSKAAIDVTRAFEIKDSQGNIISCENNICDTKSLDITIELKEPNLLEEQ